MALRECSECGKRISDEAASCPNCGKPQSLKDSVPVRHTSGAVKLLAVILVIVGLYYAGRVSDLYRQASGDSADSSPPDPKIGVLARTALSYKPYKDDSGIGLDVRFTIKNDSDQDIKDVQIVCDDFAKSGTKIDDNKRTIYEIVKAHTTRRFPRFDMGFVDSQTASTSCRITDLSIAYR
jgi:zinc-ribbon domain